MGGWVGGGANENLGELSSLHHLLFVAENLLALYKSGLTKYSVS